MASFTQFKLWCDLIKQPDLRYDKVLSKCRNMRVCSLHFEDHMYMNPSNKTRLMSGAVPKLLEVGETIMDSSETSHPLRNSSGLDTEEDDKAKSGESSPSFSEKSLEFDFHGFSSEDLTNSIIEEEEITDAKIRAIREPRNYIQESVGAVNRNQDSCILIERPGTASCPDASDGNETQSHIGKRQDKPSCVIRRQPTLAESKWLHSLHNQGKKLKLKSSITSPDTPFIKKDSFEKRKADVGTSHEPKNIVPEENCKQDRLVAVERKEQKDETATVKRKEQKKEEATTVQRKEQKDETATALICRTYTGPIQRRIVRTKEGDTRTIVIVKKSSLKNLEAKGLIQPLGKYVAGHRYAVQSLRKSNLSQGGSNSTQNLSEHTSDNLVLRKGSDLRKNSSTQQSVICEGQEPRTESGRGQYSCSSVSTQTPNHYSSNKKVQAPVKAAYVDDRKPDEMFPIHMPQLYKTNTASMTSHLPKQQKASSTVGTQCTVSQPRTQIRSPVDSNPPPSRPLSSNSVISSTWGEDNEEPVPADTAIQESSQSNTSTSSRHYAVQPSVTNSKFQSSGHGISSDQMDISSKEDTSGGDCSLFSPLSPAGYMSDEPETSGVKSPSLPPSQVKDPGLPSKNNTGVKKSNTDMVVLEVNSGDITPQRKPPIMGNVRWTGLPLPSSLFSKPQPSSSGATNQERQVADVLKKSKMPTLSLTSAERPGVVYKAIPVSSLLQSGQKLQVTPRCKSPNKELKQKYSLLLKKQRTKYYNLLKKHKALEQKYSAVSDAGTPQQIIRDAHKFMSEECVLFLESQMLLRNRSGKGNRFSRKFMELMIEYYKRSQAGYRYLKTIFAIPSVTTVQMWMNKPPYSGHSLGLVTKDNGSEATSQSPMLRITSTYQEPNSDTKPSKRKKIDKKRDREEKSYDSDDSEESSSDDNGS